MFDKDLLKENVFQCLGIKLFGVIGEVCHVPHCLLLLHTYYMVGGLPCSYCCMTRDVTSFDQSSQFEGVNIS